MKCSTESRPRITTGPKTCSCAGYPGISSGQVPEYGQTDSRAEGQHSLWHYWFSWTNIHSKLPFSLYREYKQTFRMKKLHWDSKWSPASPTHVRAHIASDSLASSRKQISAQLSQVARARPSRPAASLRGLRSANNHLPQHIWMNTLSGKQSPSQAKLV